MTSLAQLEACTNDVATAVQSLADYCWNFEGPVEVAAGNTPQPLVPPEAPSEAHQTRRSILANVAKLQTLLYEPADFIQQLAAQVRSAFPNTLPDGDVVLTCMVVESAARLSAVARRVSGAGLYTPQWQRSFQRCR